MRGKIKKISGKTATKIILIAATVLILAATAWFVIGFLIPAIPAKEPTNEEIYDKAKEYVEITAEDSIIPEFPKQPIQIIPDGGIKGSYRVLSFFQFRDLAGESQMKGFVIDMKISGIGREWAMERLVIEDRVYDELVPGGYWWP